MKTFFRFSLAAAGLAVVTLTHAQNATPAPSASPQHMQALRHAKETVVAEHLGLTSDQKAKMKAIRAQTSEAVKTVKANTTLTPEQQHEQIAVLYKSSHDQMTALLTPEQRGRLAEIMSHPQLLRAMVKKHLRMEQTLKQLALTPEQRTKIHDIRRQTAESVKSIRADATLTPEQKKAKAHEAMRTSRDQVRGVLTPDQQKKLNEIRQRLLAPLGPFS
ncbi:MAG: hypothetical protein KGJ37_06100 [Verrucomicrobiota bacterium]|nr:hypothetical protein [Verrucomicrobiota bacterium]